MLRTRAWPTLHKRVLVFSYRPSPLHAWVYRRLDSLQRRVCPLRQPSRGGQTGDRRMAHVIGTGNLAHRLALLTSAERLAPLVRGELGLTAHLHAARPCAGAPFAGPGLNQLALELGQAAQHGEL